MDNKIFFYIILFYTILFYYIILYLNLPVVKLKNEDELFRYFSHFKCVNCI